jgi:hypothetical protein
MSSKTPDDIADADDVIRLYNLLHRRDPEDETAINQYDGMTIADVFSRPWVNGVPPQDIATTR